MIIGGISHYIGRHHKQSINSRFPLVLSLINEETNINLSNIEQRNVKLGIFEAAMKYGIK